MSYLTTAERIGMEKGMELGMERGVAKGMELGMEKGMKKGIEMGMKVGIKTVITNVLNAKFGKDARSLAERTAQVQDLSTLEELSENLPLAQSISEAEIFFARSSRV